MKILVTGGSGLVGSAIKNMLITNTKEKYIFLSSKDYDLTKSEEVTKCFEKYLPNIVIHLASIVYGANSELDLQYKSLIDNSKINLNIFENCSKFNIKKIITCLSVLLSKKNENIDITSINEGPDLFLQFHQGYVHSKRLLHNLAISYKKANKGNVILLTPVNIYGYQDIKYSDRLIPSIIKNIINNKKINLAPQSIRQLLYNNDLAKIILNFVKLTDEDFNSASLYPYIVGNPTVLSTNEIVENICNKLNINIQNIEFNLKNNFSRIVNISSLPFKFNYTDFKDALNEVLDKYNN